MLFVLDSKLEYRIYPVETFELAVVLELCMCDV